MPLELEDLVFFNYHEFLAADYLPLGTSGSPSSRQTSSTKHSLEERKDVLLVINHFPNPYCVKNDEVYRSTRIVRIPRMFDSVELLDIVPQFSTYTPGLEPAALVSENLEFRPLGAFDGEVFGISSSTALVPQWVSAEELAEIVAKVNQLLRAATLPEHNWLDNCLEFATGTLYSRIFLKYFRESHMKRAMREADAYTEEVNTKLAQRNKYLRMIPISRSGTLSLDFQVPTPRPT